jgi:hypothetical protein
MFNPQIELEVTRIVNTHENMNATLYIQPILDRYTENGWRLISTQFVPAVVGSPSQGDGWLYLFFERSLEVDEKQEGSEVVSNSPKHWKLKETQSNEEMYSALLDIASGNWMNPEKLVQIAKKVLGVPEESDRLTTTKPNH